VSNQKSILCKCDDIKIIVEFSLLIRDQVTISQPVSPGLPCSPLLYLGQLCGRLSGGALVPMELGGYLAGDIKLMERELLLG